MPAIVKGTQSIQLVRIEKRFDPTTRTSWTDEHYEGTRDAALGAFRLQWGRRSNVSAELSSGTGRITISKPNAVESEFPEDRFEILTEFVEKEIWTSPSVVAEMQLYDLAFADVDPSQHSYRKLAEDIAAGNNDDAEWPNAGSYPLFAKIVRHLRAGVTGWETEYVVVRRSRRAHRGTPAGRASIGDGLFVYTTAQLATLLPRDVEFDLPDSSALSSSSPFGDYFWGWRRRPSTSVIQGIFVDQTSEFLLSEWSTIHYTQATDPPSW